MIWIYCKTTDDAKIVGEIICKSSISLRKDIRKAKISKDEIEDGCWLIESDCFNKISAMIYQIGDEVVVIEIDDHCASNILESLIRNYGFDNVKWLITKQ